MDLNTTLVKVNLDFCEYLALLYYHSNTTFVKVNQNPDVMPADNYQNSNTTLVKVNHVYAPLFCMA